MLAFLFSVFLVIPGSAGTKPQTSAAAHPTLISSFFTLYNASLRSFFMAECYNPSSQHHKKRACQVFRQKLLDLNIRIHRHCLNPASNIYRRKACDRFRRTLYGKLQIPPPKVRLIPRGQTSVPSNQPQPSGQQKYAARPIMLTNGKISYTKPTSKRNIFGLKVGGVFNGYGGSTASPVAVSLSAMFTKSFGAELDYELTVDEGEKLDNDQFLERIAFSFLWSLWGVNGKGLTKGPGWSTGLHFYLKGGVLYQRLGRADEHLDSASNAHLGESNSSWPTC